MSERNCVSDHGDEPRGAEDRAVVCRGCRLATEDALNELPQLFLDLLDPSRIATGVRAKRAPDEAPGPMSYGTQMQPAAGDVRGLIREALDRWALWLWQAREIHAPRVALATNFSSARDSITVHKFAAIDAGDPKAAKGHLRSMLAATRTAHLYSVDLEHHDTVAAGASHLRTHLATLLAGDDAGDVVRTLTRAHRLARSRATPNGPPEGRLGRCSRPGLEDACGGTVLIDQGTDMATCRRCGTTDTLDGWWEHMHRDTTAAVTTTEDRDGRPKATAAQLAAWLTRRYYRAVAETAIRKAASQDVRHGDERRPALTRAGHDGRGRTLYYVDEAQAHWDRIYRPVQAQERKPA